MQKVYCCVIERSYAENLLKQQPETAEKVFAMFAKAPSPISAIHEISKDGIEKLGYCLGYSFNVQEFMGAPSCTVFATSGTVRYYTYDDKPETTFVMITMDKNEDKDYYTRILEHILDCIDAEYDNEYEVTMQIRGIKNEE